MNIEEIGKLGIGTWYLGETPKNYDNELKTIRYAIENGIKIIDTAEMYGNGRSEKLVGHAIEPFDRSNLYIISKFLPTNASKSRLENSLDNSLKALKTDYLDLYLYHWRGGVCLSETIDELERLKKTGKFRQWGVSNFDLEDIEEVLEIENGENISANEVLYHLGSRGIEVVLKPFQDKHKIPTIAYCPLAQAGRLRNELMENKILKEIASINNISLYQLLLLFTLSQDNMVSIPRSGNIEHMKELVRCKDISLSREELSLLDKEFPAPSRRVFLDME